MVPRDRTARRNYADGRPLDTLFPFEIHHVDLVTLLEHLHGDHLPNRDIPKLLEFLQPAAPASPALLQVTSLALEVFPSLIPPNESLTASYPLLLVLIDTTRERDRPS